MSNPKLLKEAERTLVQAERRLLVLVAQAAEAADYQSIDELALAAAGVRDLVSRHFLAAQASPAEPVESVRPSGSSPDRKTKKGQYPRYRIQDGALYQIGWSKKTRKEYTHKVPGSSFKRVAATLQELSRKNGAPLRTDAIADRPSLRDGDPVPSYQIYVVLGFLRANDVIRRVGREGHVLPSDVMQQANAQWARTASAE